MSISQLSVLFAVFSASRGDAVIKGHRPFYQTGRVVGGEGASHDFFPFIVSIQREKEKKENWCHICVGNIVQPTWVLTACHCLASEEKTPLEYKDPKNFRVVAGATNWEDTNTPGRQVVQTTEFLAHPSCKRSQSPSYTYYDIGLVKLQSPLQYNFQVQPVSFFSRDADTAVRKLRQLQEENAVCFSPGWGRIQQVPKVERSPKLRVAVQTLHTAKECHKILCLKETIKNPTGKCSDFNAIEQVCVISKNASVCRGDSGGPLVCNGYVFGVASQGSSPCTFGGMQVFTGIETILKMISEHITDWDHH